MISDFRKKCSIIFNTVGNFKYTAETLIIVKAIKVKR